MQNGTPAEWGKDPLSCFLQYAQENSILTYCHFPQVFQQLMRIDAIFQLASEVHFPARNLLLPLFLLRARGAFLAAVRLAISGQVVETYAVTRSCLENALYGHYMHVNPDKALVWLKRADSLGQTKECRNSFTFAIVKDALKKTDAPLCSRIVGLYERSIDYGAHPNVLGHLTTSQISREGGHVDILGPGGDPWKIAVQTSAEVGICSLLVYQKILPDKFAEKGIQGLLQEVDCFAKPGAA